MHSYFAPRGLLHLQLWHPAARVSVLTPSRLTCDRYEVFPVRGWKLAMDDLASLERVCRDLLRVELPGLARIVAIQRWFVHGAEPVREALESSM